VRRNCQSSACSGKINFSIVTPLDDDYNILTEKVNP